ncbi:MAG: YqhA family protein, partial [Candidatus Omnitrophica bacterium]|nr:YqhA family protein [Candidatus Omnitrophota bacterium]
VIHIIGAVDLYLIGIVLLIFSFGVYELFISKIDPARQDTEINILEITTLDGLKNKLLKVIVMVLIVYFFKTILSSHFSAPLEMLYLGAAILMISSCTYFIRKMED